MAESLIETTVSPKQLTFKPGGSPTSFEVTVINDSDRFASFQLQVLAAGADSSQTSDWYRISPEVSTKKPPGDFTQFHVSITDTPIPGFVGLMNLEVRVFSMELPGEGREILRLLLEQGISSLPLKIDVPVREFQVYPGNQLEIPVRVTNPSQLSTNALISCFGVEALWFVNGNERRLQIPAGRQVETSFTCQLPDATQLPSQEYLFKIEAAHVNGPPTWVEGKIDVLPMGLVEFTCEAKEHRIPTKLAWLPQWHSDPVTYTLEFENQSNLYQQINIAIRGDDQKHCTLEIDPEQTELSPRQTSQVKIVTRSRRPWVGKVRKLVLEAEPILSDQRIGSTRPTTQLLKLNVLPIIPAWLLFAGGALLLWLAWSLSWLNPNNPNFGHRDPVNSVQFNGVGEYLVSASNDQNMIEWDVAGFFIPWENREVWKIGKKAGKAVRVVRYRPVDNNLVAVGLENGEIQLRDFLGNRGAIVEAFSSTNDDRVLALEFTKDSRYLYSGHGSGSVFQWDIAEDLENRSNTTDTNKQPTRDRSFGFVVSALKFIGKDDQNLAVAGRFNKLVVWDLVNDQVQPLPYPRTGGQHDYIFSIDTPEFNPYRLVTADKQGYISLWDLEKCSNQLESCTPIDEWADGHGGNPVRAVALSADGCYLASGGDDGRIVLWPLTIEGKRASEFTKGKEVAQLSTDKKVNSIDIKVVKDNIFIANGSDDPTEVQVQREKRLPQLGCEATPPPPS